MNGSRQGFTLIEALVALAVLGIVAGSIVPSITGLLGTNNNERTRRDAVAVARSVVRELHAGGIANLPLAGSEQRQINLNGRSYTVRVDYCLKSTFCVAATTRHLNLEVNHAGRSRYTAETVISTIQ